MVLSFCLRSLQERNTISYFIPQSLPNLNRCIYWDNSDWSYWSICRSQLWIMILPNCVFATINSTLQNPNHLGSTTSRGNTCFTGVFTNNLGQTMLFDICSGWELCIKYRILFVVLRRSKFQHKIRCVVVRISWRWFRCSKKCKIVLKLSCTYYWLKVQCGGYFTIAK